MCSMMTDETGLSTPDPSSKLVKFLGSEREIFLVITSSSDGRAETLAWLNQTEHSPF